MSDETQGDEPSSLPFDPAIEFGEARAIDAVRTRLRSIGDNIEGTGVEAVYTGLSALDVSLLLRARPSYANAIHRRR